MHEDLAFDSRCQAEFEQFYNVKWNIILFGAGEEINENDESFYLEEELVPSQFFGLDDYKQSKR